VRAKAVGAALGVLTITLILPTLLPAHRALAAPAGDAGWLEILNFHRNVAHLPRVREDPTLSANAARHARFIVEQGLFQHFEDPTKPGYSRAGDEAGTNSEIAASSDPVFSAREAIEGWMTAPFHAFGLLDPALVAVGYAAHHDGTTEPYKSSAVLDVGHGLSGSVPTSVGFPVRWPGNETTITTFSYDGGERPDPLTSCKGYSAPTGAPVLVRYDRAVKLGAFSIKANGKPIEACAYDGATYANPEPADQADVRDLLAHLHAVVIIPRAPLTPNTTYAVSVTASGRATAWHFRAGGRDGSLSPTQQELDQARQDFLDSINRRVNRPSPLEQNILLIGTGVLAILAYTKGVGPVSRRRARAAWVAAAGGWVYYVWVDGVPARPELRATASNLCVAALAALTIGLLVTRLRRHLHHTWKPPRDFFIVKENPPPPW
jgi:hypothetical protein